MSEPNLSKPPLIGAGVAAVGWVAAFLFAPEGIKMYALIGLAVLFAGLAALSFLAGRGNPDKDKPIYLDEGAAASAAGPHRPVFGPGAAPVEVEGGQELSPADKRAAKAAAKAAKKRAAEEAKFQKKAQKEAEKAAKAAGKVSQDPEAVEMQEWFQQIKEDSFMQPEYGFAADGSGEVSEAFDSSPAEPAAGDGLPVFGAVAAAGAAAAQHDSEDGDSPAADGAGFAAESYIEGDAQVNPSGWAEDGSAPEPSGADELRNLVDSFYDDEDFLRGLDTGHGAGEAESLDASWIAEPGIAAAAADTPLGVPAETIDVPQHDEHDTADSDHTPLDVPAENIDVPQHDEHDTADSDHTPLGVPAENNTQHEHDHAQPGAQHEGDNPMKTATQEPETYSAEIATHTATDAQPVLVSDPRVAAVASQIAQLVADAEWAAEQRAAQQLETIKAENAAHTAELEAAKSAELAALQAETDQRLQQASQELADMRRAADDQVAELTQKYEAELAGKADPIELDRIRRANSRLSENLEEAEANLQQVIAANSTVSKAAATSARLQAVARIRRLRQEMADAGVDENALELLDGIINDFRE